MPQEDPYKPISDYAAIGNLRSVALVGRDGSIDWCAFPHMDRGSVFAAILDHRRGGRFRVHARGGETQNQEYISDSNVVKTTFRSGAGRLTVTDLMPLDGNIHACGKSSAPSEIHRLLGCEREGIEVEVEWSPRFDYARAETRIERADGGWLARGGDDILSLAGLDEGEIEEDETGPTVRARFRMKKGEQRVLVTRWGSTDTVCRCENAVQTMRRTVDIWREWSHREGIVHSHEWAGEWLPHIIRSALACKLLTHADTGAIAAAPTTSLPETIGGVRNWDYRFTWVRDAALTAQALISIGHSAEAIEFLHWLERVSAAGSDDWSPRIMFGLHGEREMPEEELEHLEGYRGSKPVNVGNGAADQFQLEVYGEFLNMGYELLRRGEELEPEIMDFLQKSADYLEEVWEEPDKGIWEVRGESRHFVYSKVMAWAGLDRAVHLAEGYGLKGDVKRWREARERIRREVLEKGYDEKVGAFVQSFGSKDLDAANLRISLLEFLPFDDPRVQGTIDRTLEQLTENGMVYRYLNDDGLPGKEGTFCLCTFWLVDALALSGRLDEAEEIYETMLAHANHVGLFSEQIDAATGEFLGNFPQAFTHIGLINSALYLAHAKGRPIPEPAPIGTSEHRKSVERAK